MWLARDSYSLTLFLSKPVKINGFWMGNKVGDLPYHTFIDKVKFWKPIEVELKIKEK